MEQSQNKSSGVLDKIINFVDIIASIMMVLLTLVVFGEVLSRYVFNYPLVYSNELTKLLFPWVIFIAGISITKNEGHLSINFFRELLPKAGQKWAFVFAKLVMLYFSVFMMLSSYQIAQAVSRQVLPMLRISKAWLYASITVSFAAICIILIYQIILIVVNKLEPPREEDILHDLANDR
jgi:TRAP-type C4-dicarboxylate transport system permease small subunit